MPKIDEIRSDPEFYKLSDVAKRDVLRTVDADFASLGSSSQDAVIAEITKRGAPARISGSEKLGLPGVPMMRPAVEYVTPGVDLNPQRTGTVFTPDAQYPASDLFSAETQTKAGNILNRTAGAVAKGGAGIITGIGNVLNALGTVADSEAVRVGGAGIASAGKTLENEFIPETAGANAKTMTEKLPEVAGSAIGSMAGFRAAGTLLGRGVGAVAGTGKAGAIAEWLASSALETSVTAGQVHEESIQEGESPQEAAGRAGKFAAISGPITAGLNKLGMFNDRIKNPVLQAVAELGGEVAQETSEQITQNMVTGKPWNEGVAESAVGAVFGSLVGGAAAEHPRVTAAVEDYHKAVKEHGASPETARLVMEKRLAEDAPNTAAMMTTTASKDFDPAAELTAVASANPAVTDEDRAQAQAAVKENPDLAEALKPLTEPVAAGDGAETKPAEVDVTPSEDTAAVEITPQLEQDGLPQQGEFQPVEESPVTAADTTPEETVRNASETLASPEETKAAEGETLPASEETKAAQAETRPLAEAAAEVQSGLPKLKQRPFADAVEAHGRWEQKLLKAEAEGKTGTAVLAGKMVDKYAVTLRNHLGENWTGPLTAEEILDDARSAKAKADAPADVVSAPKAKAAKKKAPSSADTSKAVPRPTPKVPKAPAESDTSSTNTEQASPVQSLSNNIPQPPTDAEVAKLPKLPKPRTKKAMAEAKTAQEKLAGGFYRSYGGGIDEILKVDQSDGHPVYTVRDTATGQERTHGTWIDPRRVVFREAADHSANILKVIEGKPGGMSLSQVRESMPGVDKATFDRTVMDMYQRGEVYLDRHDHPASLTDAERSAMVHGGGEDYYVGIGRREGGTSGPLYVKPFKPYPSKKAGYAAYTASAEAHYRADSGVLYVNLPAMDWFKLIFDSRRAPGEAAAPDPLNNPGGTLTREEALKIAQSLRLFAGGGAFDAAISSALKNFAGEIDRALASGQESVVMVQAGPEKPAMGIRRVIRQEKFHQEQLALVGGDITKVAPPSRVFAHPVLDRMARMIAPNYGSNPYILAVESPAWIADGHWRRLGLSREEAVDALAHYFSVLRDVHGEDKVRGILFRTHPYLREAVREQANRTQGRTSKDRGGNAPGPGGSSFLKAATDAAAERGRPGVQQQERAQSEENGDGVSQRREVGTPEGVRSDVSREGNLRSDEVAHPWIRAAEIYGAGARTFSTFRAKVVEEFGAWAKRKALDLWAEAKRLWNDDSGEVDLTALTRRFERRFGTPAQVWQALLDQFRSYEVRIAREPGGLELRRRLDEARVQGKTTGGWLLAKIMRTGLSKMNDTQALALLNAMRGTGSTDVDGFEANREVTNWIARTAAALGMRAFTSAGRRDFKGRMNYFPQHALTADELRSGRKRDQVRDWNLIELGLAATKDEAEALIDEYIDFLDRRESEPKNLVQAMVAKGLASNEEEALNRLTADRIRVRRNGSLEHAREWDSPFYDPDPRRILPAHAAASAMRLAEVAQFGQDNEQLAKAVLKIAKAGGDAQQAHRMVKQIFDWTEAGSSSAERFSRFVRAWNVLKLSGSALVNSTQVAWNGPKAAGFWLTLRGLQRAMTAEGKEFGVESGADIERVLREFSAAGGGGGYSEKLLKLYGFTQTETFNRRWAANLGKLFAEDLAKKLRAKPDSRFLRDRFTDLGVNADDALKREDGLSKKAELRAGLRMSEMLNFRSDPASKTEAGNHPLGKIVLQFQGFGYEQTRFAFRAFADFVQGVKRKDREAVGDAVRQLLVMAAWWPLLGEFLRRAKDLLWRRDTKEFDSLVERAFANTGAGGGFGVASDYVQAFSRTGGFVKRAAGVTATSVGEFGEGAWKAASEGDFSKLGRWANRNLNPLFGGPVDAWLRDGN